MRESLNVVALLSGGKDSLYNLHLATKEGHHVVAIANLRPPEGVAELDSYMYQSVGHQAIELVAEALEKPLYRAVITGGPDNKCLSYQVDEESSKTKNSADEVEQLYELLSDMRNKHGVEFNAVSVGAIASSYQKSRVESICERLNLTMLAYLWNLNQDSLLQDMIDNNFHAILIKVACIGLGKEHVGKSIGQLQAHLRKLHLEYKANICGEGGEYETLVLDCPMYRKRLHLDSYEIICHSEDVYAPVYYMIPTKMHLESKQDSASPAVDD